MYKGVQDARAALRYLSEHKTELCIDPDMVFIGGNSAGGFLSLFTTFMKEDEAWSSARGSILKMQTDLGTMDASGNKSISRYTIRGIINMWGAVNDLSIIDRNEKVPALLIHGSADRIVPCGFDYPFRNLDPMLTSFFMQKVYGSDCIKNRMDSLGFPVSYLRIPGVDHEPQCNDDNSFSSYFPVIRDSILNFMNRQLIAPGFEIKGPEQVSVTDAPVVYTVKNISSAPVQWSCTGGFIAKETPTAVRVVWISGSKNKTLKATGTGKYGQVQQTTFIVSE
jgi:acetyl esterase/lipase